MHLLDTDHMSVLRYGGADALRLKLRLGAVPDTEIVSCVVVCEEQMRGWLEVAARALSGQASVPAYISLAENLALYYGMILLPFDTEAADRFDSMKSAKVRIGTQDMKIAAIALAHGTTVLTRNARHFGKVPGLSYEDWTLYIRLFLRCIGDSPEPELAARSFEDDFPRR